MHGHNGVSNSQSSRFGGGQNSQSLNPISGNSGLNLNQKLKNSATRDNMTNADRRPMLGAITKPRFALNQYDGPNSHTQQQQNATEPTLQPGQQMSNPSSIPKHKNLTLNNNSEKKFINSERISFERPNQASESAKRDSKEGFNTNTNKSEARSQSRTIGQFIPAQSTNSMTNVSQNQHLQMSGTQQRAHILKQSKSNITSKTIGLMQQRMLKTASNSNDQTTEQILKQAQYITS